MTATKGAPVLRSCHTKNTSLAGVSLKNLVKQIFKRAKNETISTMTTIIGKAIASFHIPKQPSKVVYIIPIEESHAEELFDVVDSNRDHLKEWLPWLDRNKTVDDQRNFCKFVATENTKSSDDRSFHFPVS